MYTYTISIILFSFLLSLCACSSLGRRSYCDLIPKIEKEIHRDINAKDAEDVEIKRITF